MDQQEKNSPVDQSLKTMWVLLSALGLLIIVGTAGFFFFSPDKNIEDQKPVLAATTPVPERVEEIDPIELARDSGEVPGLLEQEGEELEIEILESENQEAEEPVVLDKQEENIQPEKPVQPAVVKAAEPEYKEVSVQVFWIQVGSYSSLTKAESVSDYMKSRGLTSTVQTRDVDGKAHFRVRIGAFNTKEEADKFSLQVRELKGYEESFVIQSYMTRRIPVNS